MPPSHLLPPCDWEATRAAYLERFGPLFDARPSAEEKGEPFWVLCFWNPARPRAPAVYASFGAAAGDVFMTAVAPGLGLEVLVEGAVRAAPPDPRPLTVLAAEAMGTPFGGVIVLPDEQGGFSVGAEGAARPVRRVAALTRRERIRAQVRSVEAVLPGVLAAGGQVADVLRECTVEPSTTRTFRTFGAPANVRSMRRLLADLALDLAELGPSDDLERRITALRVGLAHYEAGLPHVPTEAELAARMSAASSAQRLQILVDHLVERGLDRIVGELPWDAWTIEQFRVFLALVIAAHPDARPHLEAVVARRETRAAPPELSPAEHRKRLLSSVREAAEILAQIAPGVRVGRLVELGIAAIDGPRDRDHPDYVPVLTASTGWPIAVRAMIKEVFPSSTAEERAALCGYKLALSICHRLDDEVEGDTPFERLVSMARYTAFFLSYGWAMGMSKER